MSMKISVIIPTRNNGSRVAATLRYLFHQTILPDRYEIIVVDNGSTDNTEEILSELEAEAANFRWIKELKIGRAHARNRGILEALGELLLFLDDDIEIAENHLACHLACHEQSKAPIAVIGRVIDVSPIKPAWVQDYFHARQVAGSPLTGRENSGIPLGLYFATGNVSLLRSTLESIRINRGDESLYFDPAFRVREDGDMGCRLIKKGVRFVFPDEIQCRHYHPRSWESIRDRSYDGGYALVQLTERHPETLVIMQRKVTTSRLINSGLGLVCLGLFGPAFLLKSIWPELLRKVVGGTLVYQTNRGFQQALRDRSKGMTALP